MPPIVLSAMLVVANITGAGMIVPQVVRLHRLKTSEGLSASWIGAGLAMNLWWVGYGLAKGLWGIVPVSAVAFALYVIMTLQYGRLNGPASLRLGTPGLLAIGLVPVPALILDGWATAGIIVGLCYAVLFAPAAITAVRATVLDGVSPVTWVMAGTEAAVWVVYGINQGDAGLVVGGSGGLTMSLIILVRLAQHAALRRRAAKAESPTAPTDVARVFDRTPSG